jgi:hypothetical protein
MVLFEPKKNTKNTKNQNKTKTPCLNAYKNIRVMRVIITTFNRSKTQQGINPYMKIVDRKEKQKKIIENVVITGTSTMNGGGKYTHIHQKPMKMGFLESGVRSGQ